MVWCFICEKTLVPHINVIKRHATLHSEAADPQESEEPEIEMTKLTDVEKIAIRLSLVLSALVVARNISFLLLNFLTPLLKKFATDSLSLQRLFLGRLSY